MNSCEKYWWITEHPAFRNKDHVGITIDIEPHMICKETNRIENFRALNTTLQLWIEVMVPYDCDGSFEQSHNTDLDCGGFTWEEAIDNLYDLVLEHYGSYTQEELEEKWNSIFKIKPRNIIAPSRKLKAHWSLGNYKWSNYVLSDDQLEIFREEQQETLQTISALTNYRKTCSIDEYDAVDDELEKERYTLYVQTESIKHKFNLRKP